MKSARLDSDEKRFLRDDALQGWEIVDATARLCAMNLLLHGIGASDGDSFVTVDDALRSAPSEHFDMVLTNPPFGRRSSYKVINAERETEREDMSYLREDFWATTFNKQLNFLQHVQSLLTINGRAAIVVPDNVLFEGGAGETIRRRLLQQCNVHTGGTTFHFVTAGFDAALERARAAAGDGDVDIAGGASTVRQALSAAAIDELVLDIVPVLLGVGERLFDGVEDPGLRPVEVIHSPYATHVHYRVGR
jgi:hypothetical protein